MNERTLLIRELDDNEAKDGEYVKRKIETYLQEFGLLHCIDDITFVTDRGTNMVSALRYSNHIHCFAHLINNTVGKMMKDLPIVKAATSIVQYFKKSGNNNFSNTLKSNVSTRWNTVYFMGDSILPNFDEIRSILRSKKVHLTDLAAISYDKLKLLCDFLKPFKEASTALEGAQYPTLYLVNPWYHQLLEHMSPNTSDSVFIADIKKIGLQYWIENVSSYVTYHHDIATFLHPQMKKLNALSAERQKRTHDKVSSMLEKFDSGCEPQQMNRGTNQISSVMHSFMDNNDDIQESELEEYKNIKVRTMTNLLQWCRTKKPFFQTCTRSLDIFIQFQLAQHRQSVFFQLLAG